MISAFFTVDWTPLRRRRCYSASCGIRSGRRMANTAAALAGGLFIECAGVLPCEDSSSCVIPRSFRCGRRAGNHTDFDVFYQRRESLSLDTPRR
ncbi:hypothetical protein KCP71_12825 [Salmonella enterica subsp. enterica]|nr:hypothetical protein KCP71_12825 [Salmonella enterica subsp. enterica]